MVLVERLYSLRQGALFLLAVAFLAGWARGEPRDREDSLATARAPSISLSLRHDLAVLTTAETAAAEQRSGYDIRTTKWLSGDWGGARTELEEQGINLSFILTMSCLHSFRGGLETHNANSFSGDWRMNFRFDLDKLGLVPGGFFFIRGKSSFNNSITADVGSLESVNWVVGSSGDQEFFIDKWWYGQRLLGDRLEFRVGKLLTPVDLFDAAAYAKLPWDQFLNANLNRSPNVPHRKALGAYTKVKLGDWAYVHMAGVDADQSDSTLAADVERALHGSAHFIGLGELMLTPKFKTAKGDLGGNYRLGWWYDPRVATRYTNDLGGLLAPRRRGDDWGWYLCFDQLAWKENDRPNDKQGLGLFLRYGFAHPDINPIHHFWSLGAQYEGLFPDRHKDVLAFGVAQSVMSKTLRHEVDNLADRETVYELYYAYHATPWCVITPDLQFITNPGGHKDARDAILGGLRVRIAF